MPVREDKIPNIKWKQFNTRPTDLSIIQSWPWGKAHSIGIITGQASGDVFVLDFDLKYDLTEDLYQRWESIIPSALLIKLTVAKTRSEGRHIYYRCPGSTLKDVKLAKRYTTDFERQKCPGEKEKTLIETRGHGGYAVIAPSPNYAWIEGDYDTIRTISLDEEQFLLDSCRSFQQVIVEERPRVSGTSYRCSAELDPTEDYDSRCDVGDLLVKAGWRFIEAKGAKDHYLRPGDSKARTSGNFDHDRKQFSVFSSNTSFETAKAYRPWMVYAVLSHGGDYSLAWHALKDQGYGKPFDYKKLAEIKLVLTSGSKTCEQEATVHALSICEDQATADKYLEKAKAPVVRIPGAFWHFEENDKGKKRLAVDASKFSGFMTRNGFFKHYPPGNSNPIFIRIENSVATEVNISSIIDFIAKYVLSLPFEFDGTTRPALYNLVFHLSGTYFTEAKIQWFQSNTRTFIKDTNEKAFVFFRNCIVIIKKDGCSTEDYSSLGDQIVWQVQVKDFDFEFSDYTGCDFEVFMRLLSGSESGLPLEEVTARYDTNIKMLGYLMHSYKNPGRSYAIIGCEDTETVELGGGTGKSIIGVALSKMVPTTVINGKEFDPNKNFAWQSYKMGDTLINIDDAHRKFDIEIINSQVTNDLRVERKNQHAITIPAADSPKFYLSTNYVLDESKVSQKRRIKKLIIAPFFSLSLQPADYFKRMFFEDWDKSEWNKFYSYMISNISRYLTDPIIEPAESSTLVRKGFTTRFGTEVFDFLMNASTLDTYSKPLPVKDSRVPDKNPSAPIGFSNLSSPIQTVSGWHSNFLAFSGQDIRDYNMKKFSMALITAAAHEELFPKLKKSSSTRTSEYYFDK